MAATSLVGLLHGDRQSLGCVHNVGAATSVAVAFLFTAFTLARGDEQKQSANARDSQVLAELEKPTSVHLSNLSLDDAILALSKAHGIPISVHNRSFLRDASRLWNNVTVNADGITLREALKRMVESAITGAKADVVVKVENGMACLVSATGDQWPWASEESTAVIVRGMVHLADGTPAANCSILGKTYVETIALHADTSGVFTIRANQNLLDQDGLLVRSADNSQMAILTPSTSGKNGATVDGTLQKARSISIHVADAAGKPVAGAYVAIAGQYGAYQRTGLEGLTNGSGTIALRVPEKYQIGFIYAFKPGAGLDYHSYVVPRYTSDLHVKAPTQPGNDVRLTFASTRPLTLKYVDEDGKPAAGVTASLWYFTKPGETGDLNGGSFWESQTGASGEAIFDWIPAWQTHTLTFMIVSDEFSERESFSLTPGNGKNTPIVTLNHLVELSGSVRDAAGKPAAGALVELAGKGYGYNERYRREIRTDTNGNFRTTVAPDELYMAIASTADKRQISAVRDGIPVFEKKAVHGIDLVLLPATHVKGRLTLGADWKPLAEASVGVNVESRGSESLNGVDFPHDPKNHDSVCPSMWRRLDTDAHGRFELDLGPGKYSLQGSPQIKWPSFQITTQRQFNFELHADLPASGTLHGVVVTGAAKTPVAGAKVWGVVEDFGAPDIEAVTNSKGDFDVTRKLRPTMMYAYTADDKLGGIVEIEAGDSRITIPIAPTAEYSARILDEQKKPIVGRDVECTVHVTMVPKDKNAPFRETFEQDGRTDSNGRVHIRGLVVGIKYEVGLNNTDGKTFPWLTTLVPKPGKHDLGDLIYSPRKH